MRKKNTQTITIKSNEENPEPIELIAASIIEISESYKKIENSKIKKRAIILLIQDMIPGRQLGIKEIELVLNAVPRLAEYWIKSNPLPKK